jgi:hypothetical protein
MLKEPTDLGSVSLLVPQDHCQALPDRQADQPGRQEPTAVDVDAHCSGKQVEQVCLLIVERVEYCKVLVRVPEFERIESAHLDPGVGRDRPYE